MEKFYVRKIMGSNVKTRMLNRILCETEKQLQTNCFFGENDGKQEKISRAIYDMYWEFVKMDAIYYEYIDLEQKLSNEIKIQVEKGINNINDIIFDDPNIVFLGLFDEFFWHLQRILRYRIKFLNIVYPNVADWDKGKERRNKLIEIIGSSNISKEGKEYYFDMMESHGKILEKYTDIRNSFEHSEDEKNNKFDIILFTLTLENNCIVFNQMKYKDNDIIVSCSYLMKQAFENLYYHMEDFLEMILNLNIKNNIFCLRRIFQETQNKLKPYEIDLKEYLYQTFVRHEFKKLFEDVKSDSKEV